MGRCKTARLAACGLLVVLVSGGCPVAGVNEQDLQRQIDELTAQLEDLSQRQSPTGPIHCWDLNGNGQPDPEEDINGDGLFNALDCQGVDGAPGQPGTDGADGRDGRDGQDGQDGQDGEDLTGVVARARIDAIGDNISGSGAISATRTAEGTYEVSIAIPEELYAAGLDALSFPVIVTPEPIILGGQLQYQLVATTQPLAYADTDGNSTPDTLTVRVFLSLLDVTTDFRLQSGAFSILVLEP